MGSQGSSKRCPLREGELMPCARYNIKGLGAVFLKFGKGVQSPAPCVECRDVSEFFCDYQVVQGVTCDVPLCKGHAHEIGPDKHLCTRHLAQMNVVPLKHGA